ncbi:MAG: PIN domain-containing protein [Deltaproteobacteria bacterium]|nr:PIN domain-containing protein [Deltaproteobacteria bacterium]
MIWIDSSFAVEWLLGTDKAKRVKLPQEAMGILPQQYAETFVFFLRRGLDPTAIANELESLELIPPEKTHLQLGAQLYAKARLSNKSKATLADAVLAAVVLVSGEKLLAFDRDFSELGLQEKNALWQR